MRTSPRWRGNPVARPGAILLLATLALAACGPVQSGSSTVAPASAAPLASRIVPASTLQGQLAGHEPTVLLFMATGCASCAAQVRELQQAMASHPGVQAVGIDLIPSDTPARLRSFLEAQGLADAPFLWVIDRDGSLLTRYGVAELDATVGIARRGVVRFKNPGSADAAQLASQLAALLKA